jgi:alkylated DNA nucleotide flippase Atl1
MRSVPNKPHPGSRADRIRARVLAIPEGFVQTYSGIDPEAPRLVGSTLAKHPPPGNRRAQPVS